MLIKGLDGFEDRNNWGYKISLHTPFNFFHPFMCHSPQAHNIGICSVALLLTVCTYWRMIGFIPHIVPTYNLLYLYRRLAGSPGSKLLIIELAPIYIPNILILIRLGKYLMLFHVPTTFSVCQVTSPFPSCSPFHPLPPFLLPSSPFVLLPFPLALLSSRPSITLSLLSLRPSSFPSCPPFPLPFFYPLLSLLSPRPSTVSPFLSFPLLSHTSSYLLYSSQSSIIIHSPHVPCTVTHHLSCC